MKESKALQRKDFLELLARSKTAKRRKLLAQWADKNDLMAVSECIENVLKGNVRLTPLQIKKLRRHKKSLRLLAKKNAAISAKKRAIVQNGGFLPFLLPGIVGALAKTVLPVAIGAIGSAITKKKRR